MVRQTRMEFWHKIMGNSDNDDCVFGGFTRETLVKVGSDLKYWLSSSYLSRSLADRWGTTVDFTTSFLHSSRFSAFRSVMFHGRPVHSLMLSSHRFLCLPLRLPPWTFPCRIVLASPDDRVTCPYHFSLRLFTVYWLWCTAKPQQWQWSKWWGGRHITDPID